MEGISQHISYNAGAGRAVAVCSSGRKRLHPPWACSSQAWGMEQASKHGRGMDGSSSSSSTMEDGDRSSERGPPCHHCRAAAAGCWLLMDPRRTNRQLLPPLHPPLQVAWQERSFWTNATARGGEHLRVEIGPPSSAAAKRTVSLKLSERKRTRRFDVAGKVDRIPGDDRSPAALGGPFASPRRCSPAPNKKRMSCGSPS